MRRLELDSDPRFPASLQLAGLLKAVAWIVSLLAGLLLVLAVVGASVAPIGLAIAVAIMCYAIFNHLVLYAAAEGLAIAVAVERNTRITATLLRQVAEGANATQQRDSGGQAPATVRDQELDSLEEAIRRLSSGSAMERELAARSLGLLGAKATKAIPTLEIAAQDPDRRVRSRAEWALEEIRRGK